MRLGGRVSLRSRVVLASIGALVSIGALLYLRLAAELEDAGDRLLWP